MKLYIKNTILLTLLSILFSGCTETFPLLTNTYEEIIVIEATLTNELKNQEIKITKTSKFEDEEVKVETGAVVVVKDNQNNEYPFEENGNIYKSVTPFQAEADKQYTLEVKTKDGKIYQSTPQTLTTVNPIKSVVPSLVTNKDNETGVQINVNNYDPQKSSNYYRYEYDETYKVVVPRWSSLKLITTSPQSVALINNDPSTRTCYSTKKSTEILLVNTNDLSEDRVNFPIRFIEKNNYIIGHRYSILVKQYIESLDAYTFNKTLRDMSSSSGILSPKQPGLISGNIKCINDSSTKVIGFFEVASYSEMRLFFNYDDFFPFEPVPYFSTCDDIPFKFCFGGDDCSGESMIYNINNNLMTYISNAGINYTLVDAVCGDCTSFSSNVKPSFWTE
ncbi:DUF4249 domain-containing protein [Flavobacterium johnsoniae]|uniref:DUF4249 domain-containing protein n=1 Tax=Flavobacterium johnsoniae TaxID=986 RepID=A0A1M5GPF2_FLAJO|nr:DUF4249 domain-containing protein [Flavobacterium johnsoniae]SHG05619.1 protein of unknown function [Flavobacterium johnsoniae]